MDFEINSAFDYEENLRNLRYTNPSLPCTTFEITTNPTVPEPINFNEAEKSSILLSQWLYPNLSQPSQNDNSEHSLRLIIAPRVSEMEITHIPFSKNNFRKIISHFHLPKSLVQAMSEVKFHFSCPQYFDETDSSWSGFVLRTAPDFFGQNDLVIAIAYEPHTGCTNAILFGSSHSELESIRKFLKAGQASTGHPWLLLTLVSLLQLRRYKDEEELIDIELESTLVQAQLNRTEGHGVRASPAKKAASNKPGEHIYPNLTKNVLELFSRASAVSRDMKQFCKVLDRIISTPPRFGVTQNQTWQTYIDDQTAQIKLHIEATKDTILNLSEDNQVAAERLSLIMSSIWNLIAQEESQKSRGIAQNARIIAALTMVFLPFTFVATLFSMPLLNWQHSPGETVISGRALEYFKLYWIIGASLTVIVVTIWGLWISWNRRREAIESEKGRIQPLSRRSTVDPALKVKLAKALSRWKQGLWRPKHRSKRTASQSGHAKSDEKNQQEHRDDVGEATSSTLSHSG